MISKFLVKSFVKNNENTKDSKVRNSYGTLGGIVGIIVNFVLFLIKFSVGMLVLLMHLIIYLMRHHL